MFRNFKFIKMKNKFRILLIVALGSILFTTCKKDPDLPMPALQTAVIPKLLKVSTKDQTINFFDQAAFKGSFTVDTYYADKPESIEVWVTWKGDKTKKALVQNVTSFPATIDVTVSSLVSLLSAYVTPPLKTGDYFKFYTVIILKDGTVVSAFDSMNQFNSSIANMPGASLDLTYTVVCPLNLADFVGDYTMDDGYPSDLCTITVSLDPNNANGLIINNFYGGTGTGDLYPVKISVNKTTYGISVPSPQVFASWLWNTSYKNATLSNLSGTLDACTKNFDFKADLNVSAGSFGTQSFTCTKN
jgi:hypothetical protein